MKTTAEYGGHVHSPQRPFLFREFISREYPDHTCLASGLDRHMAWGPTTSGAIRPCLIPYIYPVLHIIVCASTPQKSSPSARNRAAFYDGGRGRQQHGPVPCAERWHLRRYHIHGARDCPRPAPDGLRFGEPTGAPLVPGGGMVHRDASVY